MGENEGSSTVYGRLQESVHYAGYSMERACTELEWLLDDDRWKQLGFNDINVFLKTISLSEFKIAVERRKKLAKRLSELEAKQTATAKALGVDEKTVRRDLGNSAYAEAPQPEGPSIKDQETIESAYAEKEEKPAMEPPPSTITSSGSDVVEAVSKAAEKEEKKKQKQEDLEEKKSEIAAQIRDSPDAPNVWLSSYDAWLPTQPDCDLLLTDPPYLTDVDDIEAFAESWLPMALKKVKPTGRAFIFIGAYPEEIQAYFKISMPTQVLVWTYRNTLGPKPKYDYIRNLQFILYYRMQDAPPLDSPILMEQISVQDFNHPARSQERYHAWQKPDEIAERFIRHSTKSGDIVLDPFCCTGTFPLAACRLGRVGLGCDISEENINIALDRGCIKK